MTPEDPDVTSIFRSPQPPKVDRGSPIELTLVRQSGVSASDTKVEWIAFEVWTHNRIYLMNGQMRCVGVIDRSTNSREPSSSFLGSILTGGRYQGPERIELAQPFPVPGMRAVFRRAVGVRDEQRFGETSKVERVVIRLGVTTLNTEAINENFHELTARFFMSTK